MSPLGAGSVGAVNLAGSFAGAQRADAQADRLKERASERSLQADRQKMSAHNLEDVGEADLSPDRDPDGREPLEQPDFAETCSHSEAEDGRRQQRRNRDALGERGLTLDCEA